MTKHELEIGGRRAVVRSAGNGPAVIVVPGLGLSGRFYEQSFEAFADAGLRLVVPDLPGSGGTRGGALGQNVTQMSEFAVSVADALGIERAIWLGHSLGAQVVLELAVSSPQRIRGIILVGPTGRPGPRKLPRQAWALLRETVRAPFPVVLRVASDYLHTSPLSYLGTWLRFGGDQPLEKLRAVRAPALVLVGTRDPVIDTLFLDVLLRRLPNARLERVPGGTHALPRGSVADFNAAVLRFCREVNTGGTNA